MKKLIRFSTVVSILIIILPLIGIASAVGYKRYTTESVSEQERVIFLESKNFRMCDTESKRHPISCFAISEAGLIALGFDAGEDAEINIYNSEGHFLYGYRFFNNGSTLVIFFEGEALSIFWGKRNYIASFDSDGNCLQLRKAINTNQTADAYHNDRWRPANGKIGDIQYSTERGFGLVTTYTHFTIEDREGNQTVIYAVEEEYYIRTIAVYIFLIVFLALFAVMYKYQTENLPSETEQNK